LKEKRISSRHTHVAEATSRVNPPSTEHGSQEGEGFRKGVPTVRSLSSGIEHGGGKGKEKEKEKEKG
jgi:hypothetical protein